MKRRCEKCGVETTDNTKVFCPSCGTGLPKAADDSSNITHEQEVKIAERVAAHLEESKSFKWGIIRGLLFWVGGIIGLALLFIGGSYLDGIHSVNETVKSKLANLDLETSNKIASVQFSIQTNILAQFQEPRIKETVSSVAANQASNLLSQQIEPQIIQLRTAVDATLTAYSNALVNFEANSSNALAEVKSTAEISSLVARANSDEYEAIEKLFRMAHDVNMPPMPRLMIGSLVNAILSRQTLEAMPNHNVGFNWNGMHLDSEKSSLDDIKEEFYAHGSAPNIQGIMLDEIIKLERISKYDRLKFFMEILQTNPSLSVRFKAGYYIALESKIDVAPPAIQAQVDWWNANKDRLAKEAAASPK